MYKNVYPRYEEKKDTVETKSIYEIFIKQSLPNDLIKYGILQYLNNYDKKQLNTALLMKDSYKGYIEKDRNAYEKDINIQKENIKNKINKVKFTETSHKNQKIKRKSEKQIRKEIRKKNKIKNHIDKNILYNNFICKVHTEHIKIYNFECHCYEHNNLGCRDVLIDEYYKDTYIDSFDFTELFFINY
jgi:hypothetical protein